MSDNLVTGLSLVKDAFTTTHDTANMSDHTYDVSIVLRNEDHTYEIFNKYDINLDSIKVLFFKEVPSNDRDAWDGQDEDYVIFEYDKGLGVLTHVRWWGPTFSGDNHIVDICKTKDWHTFDRVCMTDTLRDIIEDFTVELILLRGE